MRTVRTAEIINLAQAFLVFKDEPEVRDALTRCANARVRSKDYDGKAIPGVKVTTTEKPA